MAVNLYPAPKGPFRIMVVIPRYDDRDGICGYSVSEYATALTEAGAVFQSWKVWQFLPDEAGVEVRDYRGRHVTVLKPSERRKAEAEHIAALLCEYAYPWTPTDTTIPF